jgi:CHAD domain-containing protein
MTESVSTRKPGSEPEFREAMRTEIARQWKAVWKALPEAIDGKDIEAVHQVRVASRRLRSAMDVASDCFPAEWYRPLHKSAKRITRTLGGVRDRDVLLAALRNERETASDVERRGIDYLIEQVEQDRKRARKAMIRSLNKLDKQGVRKQSKRRFRAARVQS